jgi:gamma-tubulin complex component 5
VQALVTQVTGLGAGGEDDDCDGDGVNFREAVDYVSRNLEFAPKAGASQDMHAMDKQFHGCVFSPLATKHSLLITLY